MKLTQMTLDVAQYRLIDGLVLASELVPAANLVLQLAEPAHAALQVLLNVLRELIVDRVKREVLRLASLLVGLGHVVLADDVQNVPRDPRERQELPAR